MERLDVSIPFFLWFPTFTSKYGMPEIYLKPSWIENTENIFIEICKITYNNEFCRRLEREDFQKLNYNFEREGE